MENKIEIGQKVKALFNGKKYVVTITHIFSDCFGVEAQFMAPFGVTFENKRGALAKMSTFFRHEIELFN